MLEGSAKGSPGRRRKGKYKGRAKTAMAKAGEVEARLSAGTSPTEVVQSD